MERGLVPLLWAAAQLWLQPSGYQHKGWSRAALSTSAWVLLGGGCSRLLRSEQAPSVEETVTSFNPLHFLWHRMEPHISIPCPSRRTWRCTGSAQLSPGVLGSSPLNIWVHSHIPHLQGWSSLARDAFCLLKPCTVHYPNHPTNSTVTQTLEHFQEKQARQALHFRCTLTGEATALCSVTKKVFDHKAALECTNAFTRIALPPSSLQVFAMGSYQNGGEQKGHLSGSAALPMDTYSLRSVESGAGPSAVLQCCCSWVLAKPQLQQAFERFPLARILPPTQPFPKAGGLKGGQTTAFCIPPFWAAL